MATKATAPIEETPVTETPVTVNAAENKAAEDQSDKTADAATVVVILPGMGNAEHEIPGTLWDAVQDLTDEETGISPWRGAHLKKAGRTEKEPETKPEA